MEFYYRWKYFKINQTITENLNVLRLCSAYAPHTTDKYRLNTSMF